MRVPLLVLSLFAAFPRHRPNSVAAILSSRILLLDSLPCLLYFFPAITGIFIYLFIQGFLYNFFL